MPTAARVRGLGPIGLVFRRAGHRRGLSAAIWLGIAITSLLGSATSMTLQLSADASLHQALIAAGDRARVMVSHDGLRNKGDLSAFRSRLEATRSATIGGELRPAESWIQTTGFAIESADGQPVRADRVAPIAQLLTLENFSPHMAVLARASTGPPAGTTPIEVPEMTAGMLAAKLGGTVCFSSQLDVRKRWCA